MKMYDRMKQGPESAGYVIGAVVIVQAKVVGRIQGSMASALSSCRRVQM